MGRLRIKTKKKKTLDDRSKELALMKIGKKALTDKIYRDAEKKLDDVTSVFYMAYFCLTLHREFGFGQTRLARALQALDDLDTELCGSSISELRELVLNECGVWLGTEDEARKAGIK